MITAKNILTEYPKHSANLPTEQLAILNRIFANMPKFLNLYEQNPDIAKTVNLFCQKVNALVDQNTKTHKPKPQPKTKKPNIKPFTEKDLYPFVSKYKDQPFLCGVYHDKGYLVASDSHILVKLKADYQKALEGKIILKNGEEVKEKYPNYKPFLEKQPDSYLKTIDFNHLLDQCKRFKKVFKALNYIVAPIKIDDVFFSSDLLIKGCELAKRIGATQISLSKTRGNIITAGDNVILIMPYYVRDLNKETYLDYNTNEIKYSYNNKIVEKNKILDNLLLDRNTYQYELDQKLDKIEKLEAKYGIGKIPKEIEDKYDIGQDEINRLNKWLNYYDNIYKTVEELGAIDEEGKTKKTTTALSVMVFDNTCYRTSKEFTSRYKRRDTAARFRLHKVRGAGLSDTNINTNINKTKFFDLIFRIKNGETFSVKDFINEIGNCFPQEIARMRGIKKYFNSKYQLIEVAGVTILLRVSNHNINSNNVTDDIEEAYSIVIKEANKRNPNTFKANDLCVTEYVYLEKNLTNKRYVNIIESILNLAETGQFTDLANADFVNHSPNNKKNIKKNTSAKSLNGINDYYTLYDDDFNELKDFGRNRNLRTIKKEAQKFLEQHNIKEAELEISDPASGNIKDCITIYNPKFTPSTPPNTLDFVPISHKEDIKTDKLGGELGKFIGEYDRYCFSIVLRGDKGAGKSRLLYQLINAFAYKNLNIGFFSLEMGLKSSVTQRYKDEYITPRNLDYINITSTSPTYDQLNEACKRYDVVAIDSWTKLKGFEQQDFDRLQKENPTTILICIFQSTTGKVTRGGNMPEFDGGIVIHVHKGGLAECEKNRYADIQKKYSVFERVLVDDDEE